MLAVQTDTSGLEPPDLDLGLALVKAGRLSEADYQRVLRMQAGQPEGPALATLLNRLGLVSEQDIAQQLAQLLDRAQRDPAAATASSCNSGRFAAAL